MSSEYDVVHERGHEFCGVLWPLLSSEHILALHAISPPHDVYRYLGTDVCGAVPQAHICEHHTSSVRPFKQASGREWWTFLCAVEVTSHGALHHCICRVI